MKKIALITGITGQDGSYLAEILLKKNYVVHGIKRKSSSFNTSRIDHIYNDKRYKNKFFLHYGDVNDTNAITNIIRNISPNEIYNLAAQSHVATSFEIPEFTCQTNAIGVLKILEAIRSLRLEKKIKFYQASSSELYGKIIEKKQDENTPFNPQSPYAISKLFAYWITKNYRDSYGIHASNGILFNHESPRRGETFVTKKITMGMSKIAYGIDKSLSLGNLNALRDWGHAKDYALMQWKILQKKKPGDYVIASEKQFSVRYFVEETANQLGINIKWIGKGLKEVGVVAKVNNKISPKVKVNQIIIKVSKKYLRPLDVDNLIGNASKAKKELNWKPQKNLKKLIKEMLDYDIHILRKNKDV